MYNDDNIGNDNMNNDDKGTNSIHSENTNNRTMNSEDMNSSTMNSEDMNSSTMNSEDMNSSTMNSEDMNNSTMNADNMYNNSVDDFNITENDMSNDNREDNNMLNDNYQREIELNTYRISDMDEVNSAQDKQKEKNKNKTGKKSLAFAVSAVLFGGLAGGAFLTTTYIGNQYLNLAGNESEADTTAGAQDSSVRTISNVETIAEASTDSTNTVSSVASAAMPSIVSITNKSVQEVQSMFGTETLESESSGSGIIVGQNDTELLIATNNHVVDGVDSISVTFIDETIIAAQVKGTDPENDLAVIAVKLEDISADTLDQITIAQLGDSDSLVIGQEVVAIGNALGYGQSVTTGIVSALDREVTIDDITSLLIQTDAAINPGNSGGALLNMQGQVIGINSSKFASTEVEGMGYAIPISTAKPIIEQLMLETTKEKVAEEERGYLGISGQNVTSEISEAYDMPIGVYIGAIQEGSGLADAGITKGDIITGFEGKTITTLNYLQSLLEYYKIGDTVTITVASEEGGEYIEKTVEVTLMGSTTIEQETTQERTAPGAR